MMSKTMMAVMKPQAKPGVEIRDVAIPQIGPTDVLVKVKVASICQFVKIIGVDADGAFAEYVRIPESNIWKLDPAIPQEYASILDPLGNAVHTVLAGEIAAKTVAVTGCGPSGLFSIAVSRAVGATTIFAIEVNEHRRKIAKEMKADF